MGREMGRCLRTVAGVVVLAVIARDILLALAAVALCLAAEVVLMWRVCPCVWP